MADLSEISAELADQAKAVRVEIEEFCTMTYDNKRLHELARIVERLCEVVAVATAEHER